MIEPGIRGRGRRWVVIALFLGILMLMGLMAHRDEVVGRARPIVLDDFAFEVVEVRPGGGGDRSPGVTGPLVVSLRIGNQARRVSFRFDPSWAVLVDGEGREHRVSSAMQREHDRRDPARSPYRAPIKAGESTVVDLVFEAPPASSGCQFRLSSGGPVGDFLDGFLSGPRRIALDR